MKLIKKVSQAIAVVGKILGVKTESDVDTYSCNYINDKFDGNNYMGSIVVEDVNCKNMFNRVNTFLGYLDTTGSVIKNADHRVSDYIDVSGISHLTISGNTGTGIVNCFYDSSKTFLSAVVMTTNQATRTIEVPSNAKYIRVTVNKTVLSTYQLERGSVATEYTSYKEFNNKEITKYLKIRKGTIGGSGSTIDVDISDLPGNETITINIAGIHSSGTSDYSSKTYLLRKYGTNNTLVKIFEAKNGAIELSLTYDPSTSKITIQSVGTYGCQYSITFI